MTQRIFHVHLIAIFFMQSQGNEVVVLPPAAQTSAQTAAAAAETAAVAAQTAASAAASAAKSAADAATAPPALAQATAEKLVQQPTPLPVIKSIANVEVASVTTASSAAGGASRTAASAMERAAAAAATTAQSAATVADTASKAQVVAAAAAQAAKVADTDAKVHAAAASAAKASAAASAAASALKAADSAADAAASAAIAARAAKNVEKPIVTVTSVPSVSDPQAKSALQVQAPGVQVTAQVPVPLSPEQSAALPIQIASSGTWSSSQWWMLQLSSLISGLTFATVIKSLCIVGNVLVQVSPLPAVKRWTSRQCTGDADAAPYVSITFGGWQWSFYGVFAWFVTGRSGFLILVHSNILGGILGLYYTTAFYQNCRSETSLNALQKYVSAVATLVVLQVCGMLTLPAERALFLTGLISSFCSFIGATSVLVTLPQVIRSKDSRSIPGPYAFANFCSCIVWSVCGWILNDPMVLMPSLFSTCCSLTALSCKVMYPTPETGEKENLEEGVATLKKTLAAKTGKLDWPTVATEYTPLNKAVQPIAEVPQKRKASPFSAPVQPQEDEGYDGTGGTC